MAFEAREQCIFPQPHVFHFCLLLYEALNDDDEEIRDLASSIEAQVQLVMGNLVQPLVSFAASQRLVAYLGKSIGASQDFQVAAALRLTKNTFGESILHFEGIPFFIEDTFHRALSDHDEVFEEERQNLYDDAVRQRALWAQVLVEVDRPSIVEQVREFVTYFAQSGLNETFNQLFRTTDNGALSRLHGAEAVELLCGIFSSAELAYCWGDSTTQTSIRTQILRLADAVRKTLAYGPFEQQLNRLVQRIT